MTASTRVLVAGGSGWLGSVIAHQLLAEGYPVRALARHEERLQPLVRLGAEIAAVDLLDLNATRNALEGVDQIVSTANNVMGSRASSPLRVDVPAYRNLTTAARDTGVRRLIHVSARNIGADSVVDFFRVKQQVEDVVRDGGVPYVILRFAAFMDVWSEVCLGRQERDRPITRAILFGGGQRRMNFIAIEDAVRFVLAVVRDSSIVDETIDVGGPSDASLAELAGFAERALGKPLKRRAPPAPVLALARLLTRPFSERVSRMVTLGYWTTLADRPFPEWRGAAQRFGIEPRTLESFISTRYGRAG